MRRASQRWARWSSEALQQDLRREAKFWKERYEKLVSCLGGGELAERLAAVAPALWELLYSESEDGVTKLRRNVALHSKVIPRPLAAAGPAALKHAQHGPRLGTVEVVKEVSELRKVVGGEDAIQQGSQVEFEGKLKKLESYVNPATQAEYQASNGGSVSGVGGLADPAGGPAEEGGDVAEKVAHIVKGDVCRAVRGLRVTRDEGGMCAVGEAVVSEIGQGRVLLESDFGEAESPTEPGIFTLCPVCLCRLVVTRAECEYECNVCSRDIHRSALFSVCRDCDHSECVICSPCKI